METTADLDKGMSAWKTSNATSGPVPCTSTPALAVRVFLYRWVILGLFCLVSMMNGFQWIQYSIISNVIMKYYDISQFTVDWFSLIYMSAYVPLIFPGMWILDVAGLRMTVTLGALGNFLASWVKVFSVSPDLVAVSFVGQTIAAVAQIFILNVPTRLAAVWFGPDQVSSACAVGVFGNQLGVALGFLFPPMLVKNHDNLDDIGNDLSLMFYLVAGVCSVLLVLILIFFREEPEVPPSVAQVAQKANDKDGMLQTFRRLFTNVGYVLVLITYGLNVAVFNAISTLLNQIVIHYYPGAEEDAGRIGLLLVVAGMAGSVMCGIILDKTHKFKETILGLYVFSLIFMIVFTFTLNIHIAVVYVVAGLLGFFMTGYLPVGFEFSAELTYPEPEGTSTALLVNASQLGGVLLTMLYSWLVRDYGDRLGNIILCVTLGIGCVLTSLIKKDYRRQAQGNKVLVEEKY